MRLPPPRGPHSDAVIERVRGSSARPNAWSSTADVLDDPDFQLSLWVLYELHYAGFEDAAPRAEDDPGLAPVRRDLEHRFQAAIDAEVGPLVPEPAAPEDLAGQLSTIIDAWEGHSIAAHLRRHGTREQVRELLAQRSILQLKEADPYTWLLPRLRGAPKAALAELLYDEFGDGVADRVHQTLYEHTLSACDLDPAYGAYLADTRPQMLALANAPTYFGLHRHLRGAAAGHLAAFEATSSLPSRKYADAIRRVGFGDRAAFYFDEHVEADSVHEHLALSGVCGALVATAPALARDVLTGALTCLVLEDRFAGVLLRGWDASPERGGMTLGSALAGRDVDWPT